jgi:uncharacterized membrane protein
LVVIIEGLLEIEVDDEGLYVPHRGSDSRVGGTRAGPAIGDDLPPFVAEAGRTLHPGAAPCDTFCRRRVQSCRPPAPAPSRPPITAMTDLEAWIPLMLSALMVALYEGVVLWIGRRRPDRMARYAHARMRVAWVAALGHSSGTEIVAVQALRNSLMSATIVASTAALGLMGSITLAGPTAVKSLSHLHPDDPLGPKVVTEGLLMCTLFASYVCAAWAMRYFNHATFAMSMTIGSAEREHWQPLAVAYVERAGLFYSWALRSFLLLAPLVAGILNPLVMPPMSALLIIVLYFFDQPAQVRPTSMRTRSDDALTPETTHDGTAAAAHTERESPKAPPTTTSAL